MQSSKPTSVVVDNESYDVLRSMPSQVTLVNQVTGLTITRHPAELAQDVPPAMLERVQTLSDLSPSRAEQISSMADHLAEVATGHWRDGTIRDGYDPAATTQEIRIEHKRKELEAFDVNMSRRTMYRKLTAWQKTGRGALIDGRWVKQVDPLAKVDVPVFDAIIDVLNETSHDATRTVKYIIDTVRRRVLRKEGPSYEFPSNTSMYRYLENFPDARYLKSTAKMRMSAADRPNKTFSKNSERFPGDAPRATGRSSISPLRRRSGGIPEDRAHVAAMCRDSERRGESPTRLTPANLRRRFDGVLAETVLEALLRGTNSVRTEQRLATSLGEPLRGINQELRQLTASRSSTFRKDSLDDTTDAYRAIDWTPKNAPRIADAGVVALGSVSPTVNARYALRQQVDEYRTERKVGGLLSAYARTFGVFHVGDELDLLCSGVNGDIVSIRDTMDVRDVLAEATATRRFHYVRADAAPVLEAYTAGSDSLPPPPHGVAFIEGRFQDDRRISNRVLAWSTGPTGIRCVLLNDTYFRSSKLRNFTSSRLRAEHFDGASANPASQLLAALAAVRTPLLDAPRRTARTSEADESKQSSLTRLRDVVTTYVALDGGAEIETRGARPSRAPDHRWTVRRHARRQWYPSTKSHEIIWIDEHTSGPRDAPLLHVERVEVI